MLALFRTSATACRSRNFQRTGYDHSFQEGVDGRKFNGNVTNPTAYINFIFNRL